MLMNKEQTDQEIAKFDKEMTGWTIGKVVPAYRDERVCTLILHRVEEHTGLIHRKKVTIAATDLGFWLDKPRMLKPRKVK